MSAIDPTYGTRADHLVWCKKRALEYCDRGELREAWMSFLSDMRKHPETREHLALQLGNQMLFSGFLNTQQEMRKFIEGFN